MICASGLYCVVIEPVRDPERTLELCERHHHYYDTFWGCELCMDEYEQAYQETMKDVAKVDETYRRIFHIGEPLPQTQDV